MKKSRIIAVFLVVVCISSVLQREFARGTFDPVERAFVAWLAANSSPDAALPPLTLVLYDEESSALAGVQRMGGLDAALFARAASRLGALAAGVEGLPGDPGRTIEAAGRMPLFAGYAVDDAPGTGWTPWTGAPDDRWPELSGLVGASSARFPRGFFSVPEGESGPRTVALAGRNSGRVVPSFLALAWSAAQRNRPGVPAADSGWIRLGKRKLPLDAKGAASFFPADPASVISLNELLVAAEKCERREADSPLRGQIVVLARATADIARLQNPARSEATTPPELWAQAWAALRRGRYFVPPGWWYPALLAVVATGLGAAVAGRGWAACAGAGFAVLLVYLLIALGGFASAGLLLPFVPSAGTLVIGLLSGRFILRT